MGGIFKRIKIEKFGHMCINNQILSAKSVALHRSI